MAPLQPFGHQKTANGGYQAEKGKPERYKFVAGYLRCRINSKRKRLSKAGNIRCKGDGGTKFTEGAGKP